MPGKLIQRWAIGKGGFIGEVSLFALSEEDAYVRGKDTRICVELSNLHVHPHRRQRGWGRELLSTALVHAQHRGWVVFIRVIPYATDPVELDCLLAFYRRYGFKSTRRDRREMLWHPK